MVSQWVRLKIRDAFVTSGMKLYGLRVQQGTRGDFVVEAVVANEVTGQVIEDAQVKKEDYRISAIRTTQAGKTAE